MKLEDIVLKAGDIVYFDDGYKTNIVFDRKQDLAKEIKLSGFKGNVIKIERPVKYETIYEAPKQILDKEEKEYLECFLKPFKNETKYIYKTSDIGKKVEWLRFYIGYIWYDLPLFDKGTMYKGMEVNKEYTIKELGLFED